MGYVEGDEDEGTGTRRPSEQFRAAGVGDASAPSAEACVPGGDAGDGSGVPFLMSALADGTNRCDAGCMARKMPTRFNYGVDVDVIQRHCCFALGISIDVIVHNE